MNENVLGLNSLICAQEVVGSAIAISILSNGGIPLWGGTIISVVVSFCLLFLDDINHRVLEGLFGVLVSTMAVSFMVMHQNFQLRVHCGMARNSMKVCSFLLAQPSS